MKKAVALVCAGLSVLVLSSTEAAAGPYSDELAKCLVRFQSAFTVLGQVASVGLFTDPSVSGYMGDFLKYIDKSKVQGAFLSK